MRIAVVGSGIAGLGAAWLLSKQHQVVLFEAQSRLGGHTHTHRVDIGGRALAVDTGFIVFNPDHYPLFSRFLTELGVDSQPTTMSFSVHNQASGLEYNAGTLGGLFCQRRNALSPRFLRMVADILRFYRQAPALLALPPEQPGPELGEYLQQHRYSTMFVEDHLLPMASALWSSPSNRILQFPARYLVQFMANHSMLQAGGRPEWRVVRGGSSSYIDALQRSWPVDVRLDSPVRWVGRSGATPWVQTREQRESFDHVVLACHGDDALALLDAPTPIETQVLGAVQFQDNDTVLHTDARLLPRNRAAWAAWNAFIPSGENPVCTVSYCMNLLQSLDTPEPLIVTLNRTAAIDPARILARMRYRHPVYTQASVAAQGRRSEISGRDGIWYCGAYWGWGFHEDGLRSAVEVAGALGVAWQ